MNTARILVLWIVFLTVGSPVFGQQEASSTLWKSKDYRYLHRHGLQDYNWSIPKVNLHLESALRYQRQARNAAWIGSLVAVTGLIVFQDQINTADGSYGLAYSALFVSNVAIIFTPTFSILRSRKAKRHIGEASEILSRQKPIGYR